MNLKFIKLSQKDLIVIVVAIFAGILFSILASKYAFKKSASATEVDVVPTIRTDFPAPPSKYFNSQAVDPTQIINISPNDSQQPFNSNQ